MFFLPIGQDPEFAVEPVSETGPAGGSETVDIVEVDSDDDNDYLEDDPSPSMKDIKLCAYFHFYYFYFHEKYWLEIWPWKILNFALISI